MVEVIPDQLWADIYLNSEGAGTWPDTVPVSQYNATPLSGAEGYSRFLDYPYLAGNAGKRLPTLAEFYRYADGSPQGNDADNDLAWSNTANTDRTATGTVAKAISSLNVVDCAGNLWEPTTDIYDEGGTFGWDSTILDNGKDSAESRGELNHARWRFFIAGGYWGHGVRVGARCAYSGSTLESVNSLTGLRCVAPAKN
jgi:formylglycine-generating enzyme required for sulfatase activity